MLSEYTTQQITVFYVQAFNETHDFYCFLFVIAYISMSLKFDASRSGANKRTWIKKAEYFYFE